MSPCFDDVSFEELQGKVPMEDGLWLTRPYTRKEVESALNQMTPTKAPGLDVLCALFYHNFWDMIGNDMCDVVLCVLNGGLMPEDMNHTIISLIPKTKTPITRKELC